MVYGLNSTLRELEQRKEAADRTYQAALAALIDTHGKRIYTDPEHEERAYDTEVVAIRDGYRALEQ